MIIRWCYNFIRIIKIAIQSVHNAVLHDGVEHAGYLSFLLMFTIFPFLVFFVAMLSFFGNTSLSNVVVDAIMASEWAMFIDALKPRILEITSGPPQSLLTLAILSAIWTASSIFEAIRTILNKAYRAQTMRRYVLRRLLSILEFILTIIITVVAVAALVLLPALWSALYESLLEIYTHPVLTLLKPETENIRHTALLLFGFGLLSALYYFLPNVKHTWTSTWPGTILVLSCWYVFSWTFKNYLTIFHSISVIYGSLAGVIIALFYFYICSFIFIVGAEFNYNLAKAK
jgi:membrane protein